MFKLFRKKEVVDWNKIFDSNLYMTEVISNGSITTYTAALRYDISLMKNDKPITVPLYTTYSDLFHWIDGVPSEVIPAFIHSANLYILQSEGYDMCFSSVKENVVNVKAILRVLITLRDQLNDKR
jgi:hypothetical protein